ncbi:unnamed protein product [Adineta steineri]|uniref:Uncharacterized protein n=1 Tax=Adineta steineri TaxID=433720 RepID=A0A813T1E4_9BILA|nr:unnamed protein product [Adineta steineri]CAF1186727.1 unnamed protein product [Adineta steineri]CAF1238295.1 unnamed protein product [Adineta steineri]
MKKSIQSFLNKPDVMDLLIRNINETISTTKKDKDLLLTYRDGKAAATNQSLQKNINSFLIQLYSDEVGITNPLGPKKDEKKLLLFYYLLDDLCPIVRSLLYSINLLGICLSKLLTNSLQQKGLTVFTFTGRLYFAFDLIAADNLAVHDLGGFQKNFNHGHFCRMCYVSYEYKSIPLTNISFLLRTEISHEIHLKQVLKSNIHICGINDTSDLSNLIAFHPVKSLPFDIMHDYSEGVCMIMINSILKAFSVRRILAYAQIESRLEDFKYRQNDESNKPPVTKQKHLTNNHIGGSASQKRLLFQLLHVIFNDVIDRLTDILPIYICLREIVSIVFATKIRKPWLAYLKTLTITFHSLMIERLPDYVTAKVHFITHYSELIKRNGPPRNYWCQRFQGKHLYFKRLATRSCSFKNVPFTLAKRHQLRLALLLSYDNFHNLIDKPVSTKIINPSQLPVEIRLLLVQHQYDLLTYIESQTLIHKHVKYIKKTLFLL